MLRGSIIAVVAACGPAVEVAPDAAQAPDAIVVPDAAPPRRCDPEPLDAGWAGRAWYFGPVWCNDEVQLLLERGSQVLDVRVPVHLWDIVTSVQGPLAGSACWRSGVDCVAWTSAARFTAYRIDDPDWPEPRVVGHLVIDDDAFDIDLFVDLGICGEISCE